MRLKVGTVRGLGMLQFVLAPRVRDSGVTGFSPEIISGLQAIRFRGIRPAQLERPERSIKLGRPSDVVLLACPLASQPCLPFVIHAM